MLLSACGAGDAGTGTTGGTTPDTTLPPLEAPDGDPRPVLTISDEGGFVPVEWNFRRIPRYVVMSDGTVYTQGPTTLEYPGRALPNVQTVEISDEDLAEIMALIEEAGLPEVTDERNDKAMMTIADAPDTVFTYVDEAGAEHRFAVYALGFEDMDFGDERVPVLADLLTRVDQAVAGADPGESVMPDRVDVFVGERDMPVEDQFSNTIEWPVAASYEEMTEAGAGFRCLNLEGDDASQLLDIFADANEATTVVTEDGSEYTMIVRPLLPGQESIC
jgi:hypothetical protein